MDTNPDEKAPFLRSSSIRNRLAVTNAISIPEKKAENIKLMTIAMINVLILIYSLVCLRICKEYLA